MKKIKILEVIGSMDMGGAETFLMNILKNINLNKFQLYFLCYGNKKSDYEEELKELGGIIIKIPRPSFNIFQNIKEIKKVIKNNSIDIVHCHTYYNSMYALIAAKECGIKKRITHSHSTKSEEHPNILKRFYYCISKLVINFYSTDLLACGDDAGKSLFFKNKKFKVINNGIILSRFYYNNILRKEKRKELQIPSNYKIIGHVGRFEEVKNHKFLIDLFNKYLKEHENTILLLAGDGSLHKEIELQIKKYKLESKVRLLSKRSDVNELYNVMDLFLFPSLYEGLPIVLIEAQANGVPIVASDTIDKEVNFTDTLSFLSLKENYKRWIEEIEQRIGIRKDNRNLMENSKYNIKSTVKQIEQLYSDI